MSRPKPMLALAMLAMAVASTAATAAEQSKSQAILGQNAAQQKYTFLMFYRGDNAGTRAMAQSLKTALVPFSQQASVTYVSVTDPSEQETIKQFGVSRVPLPFVLAVAPNGAITAVASQKISSEQVVSAFGTPGMADCMKAMQNRQLVLVCVHGEAHRQIPNAIADFQADPEFKDRISVILVKANDPSEKQFLDQMEINQAGLQSPVMVFMAPPAVLVGKFAANATKAEMAAALHAAGECCEDPHCKHNHGPQASKSTNGKRK